MSTGHDSEENRFDSENSKALELAHTMALGYSTAFNTVGAAVVFGLFSLLLLLSSSAGLSPEWILLSLAYFMTVLTGLYFYMRAVRYSMMATEVARRLGALETAETIYRETAASSNFLHKMMVGRFQPYGRFTNLYLIVGPTVLFLLWAVVAIH